MPRFKMTVEYDGTPYVGWQRQDNGHSVQAALEKAALSLTGETVLMRGAGRTDSGVHAMGQVVHVDLTRDWVPYTLRNALNAYLAQAGERVAVLDVCCVDDSFDARFSAIRRHYLYRTITRPPSGSSATTTSPLSVPSVVRPIARCGRSTGST